MIYYIIKNGNFYCQDKKWRDFAPFGSMNICVKEYKTLNGAKKIRDHININPNNKAMVIAIPVGMTINCAGQVFEHSQVGDNLEEIKQHRMEEFEVK